MFQKIMDRYKALVTEQGAPINILIGGILLYIPVLGHAVCLGYLMNLLDEVRAGRPVKMPKWENFEKLFFEGLPAALVLFGVMLINSMISRIFCVGFLVSIAVNLLMPAVLIILLMRLRETTDWKNALQPGAIVEDLKKDLQKYFPVLVFFFLAGIVSLIVGCCVLFPFPLFLSMMVFLPMLAEIYLASHNEPKIEAPADSATPPAENK